MKRVEGLRTPTQLAGSEPTVESRSDKNDRGIADPGADLFELGDRLGLGHPSEIDAWNRNSMVNPAGVDAEIDDQEVGHDAYNERDREDQLGSGAGVHDPMLRGRP